MLSRTLYEALRSISSGVYSDGRMIPPWDRAPSAAAERDEGIWAALAGFVVFAVETCQQLATMQPGSGREIGGAYVVRGAGILDAPYQVYEDSSRRKALGRDLPLSLTMEIIAQRHPWPEFPPLPDATI